MQRDVNVLINRCRDEEAGVLFIVRRQVCASTSGARQGLPPHSTAITFPHQVVRVDAQQLGQGVHLPLDAGGLPKAFADADAALAYHLQKLAKCASTALERKDEDAAAKSRMWDSATNPKRSPYNDLVKEAATLLWYAALD